MDIPFEVAVEAGETAPRLSLSGDLGPVPFSAENRPRRARLFALASLTIFDGAAFDVTPDLSLRFRYFTDLDRADLDRDDLDRVDPGEPPTLMSVLGKTTALLLQARPFLDLAQR